MRNSGTVTVAIPVFNGADHIAEAIKSAQSQTVPVGVHVFDNASADDTAEIARGLLGDEAVTSAPRNLGAVENFNRAARETSGEFFAWLAHDDRLRPEYVETCLSALEANPGAPACLTGIQFTDSTGAPTRVQNDTDLGSDNPRTRLRSFLRRRRWTEAYCLYRRAWLERSPLFADEYGADVLLTWWFLLRAPLAVVSDPLLEYREYPLTSVDEATKKAATSLSPDARPTHWHKARMWRRLWAMTKASDVDPVLARVARRELQRLAFWPGVVFWLADDVLDRWPWVDRMLRRAWERMGAPGRVAPTC
jgi:glycosyltransferase involved in cell wall biosynthesis